jgi:NAD(P)-dependent dehydrogenase (short-subunit alcohol dehydrogenase family)
VAEPHAVPGRLAGKVAIVTGGASGIGRATARRFASEGARVVVGDLDEPGLDALAAELGDVVATRRCDVSREDDVEQLAQAALDRFGRLDVAFANAGIGSGQRVVDADLEQWQRVLDVNLTGPFLTIKHAARRMPDGGSIVVTSSLNAVQPGIGMGAYCTSKAGVAMLVQVAALELGPAGIRVNAVAPGFVRTALTEPTFALGAIADGYVENTPMGRYATPEEIAGLVAYLASDEASFVSGSLQLIDGGAHTMKYPDVLGILESSLG